MKEQRVGSMRGPVEDDGPLLGTHQEGPRRGLCYPGAQRRAWRDTLLPHTSPRAQSTVSAVPVRVQTFTGFTPNLSATSAQGLPLSLMSNPPRPFLR